MAIFGKSKLKTERKDLDNLKNQMWKKYKRALLTLAAFVGLMLAISGLTSISHSLVANKAEQLQEKAKRQQQQQKAREAEETAVSSGQADPGKEKNAVPEAEPEDSVRDPALSKEQEAARKAAEQAAQDKKDAREQGLKEYRKQFRPKVTGDTDTVQAFLGGRKKAFCQAVADSVYSIYGEADVEELRIDSLVSDGDQEVSCHITIRMGEDLLPFLCTYQKQQDFYSLYSPQELQ